MAQIGISDRVVHVGIYSTYRVWSFTLGCSMVLVLELHITIRTLLHKPNSVKNKQLENPQVELNTVILYLASHNSDIEY